VVGAWKAGLMSSSTKCQQLDRAAAATSHGVGYFLPVIHSLCVDAAAVNEDVDNPDFFHRNARLCGGTKLR
jgi:hypothetical protein